MFDFARRLQLAAGDTARRTAMKIVAGVVLSVASGFLLAALWTWLAHGLGWGATYASLSIGGGFAVLAVMLLMIASRTRHPMPTGEDLRREVEARLNLAADAAVERAQSEALRLADMAEGKVHSLIDRAGYRANQFASDAERRAQGLVRDTARSVGLTSGNVRAAKDGARDMASRANRAANSDMGNMAKLVGAFAIGVTLAAKLQETRRPRTREFDPDDFL
ncbi:phage holin family protein [Paracoccus salsus]|uniref:phage holin family protein n=1 Tax=Paracoccus salsus TaxID=2911061 RepID=UPI001F32D516|nr:phage holin family protein [Paracoccus salsus]MCF3974457.1 phage holin family protein [Paracoccus salsus]